MVLEVCQLYNKQNSSKGLHDNMLNKKYNKLKIKHKRELLRIFLMLNKTPSSSNNVA